MDADLWGRVVECYHAVMDRPAHERSAFLAQACGSDSELRREVESLLAHEGQADDLLESPAWDHLPASHVTTTLSPTALAPGAALAGYRITAKLGAGGMGEVFRATDTRLQREVAIKMLAPEFGGNAAFLSRLQREARVLASLNHPNIAAVYGLEETGGTRAIVMELVEGLTLADRMDRGSLPLKEALDIARQIAEALEYAHERGIVHRDLKPANIKLRPDGTVKVLDFGLAKPVQPAESTQEATRTGTIIGTPAYMAPEQAAGLAVDRRVDIWGFGVVLFEMLAGGHVYLRRTTLETLAAVARDEPRWEDLPTETPVPIVHLLQRCLDKDPRRRLRDIGEARVVVENLQAGKPTDTVPIEARSKKSPISAWLIAAGMAGVAAVALFLPRPSPPANLTGILLGGPGEPQCPRLSPDGHMLAFFTVAGDAHNLAMDKVQARVGVMKPETGDSLILTGAAEYGWMTGIAWSSDGSRIYFDRNEDVPRGIFSVPVLGGKEQLVLEDAGTPESLPDGSLLVAKVNPDRKLQLFRFWPETTRLQGFAVQLETFYNIRSSPDGKEALVIGKRIGGGDSGDHVYLVDLASGAVRQVPSGLPDDSALTAVAMSRDGKSVLVAALSGVSSQVAAVPRDGRGKPRLLLSLTSVIYAMDTGPNGTIYLDQIDRPADIVRFRPAIGRSEKIGSVPYYEGGPFAVLRDGRAVLQVTAAGHTRLMAFEAGKVAVPLVRTSEDTRTPAAAVGSDQIAFFIGPADHQMIGLATTTDGRMVRRIPFEKGSASALAASPDGKMLYCAAGGTVWAVPASGGEPKVLHAGDYVAADPLGQYLLVELGEGSGNRFVRIPLGGGTEQEISIRSSSRPVWQITANAIGPGGRILSPLTSQSFYWPPGIIDPATGIATRIMTDHFGDYHGLAWTPDGQVIGVALDYRSKIWEYAPEMRTSTR